MHQAEDELDELDARALSLAHVRPGTHWPHVPPPEPDEDDRHQHHYWLPGARKLLAEDASRSNSAIGQLLGCSGWAVWQERQRMEAVGLVHVYRRGLHQAGCWCRGPEPDEDDGAGELDTLPANHGAGDMGAYRLHRHAGPEPGGGA